MLLRFFCYTKLDENTLEHSYKVISKCLIFDLRFIAVVGIFSWPLDLCRVDNVYSKPLSSIRFYYVSKRLLRNAGVLKTDAFIAL